jgi:hypothetical protein
MRCITENVDAFVANNRNERLMDVLCGILKFRYYQYPDILNATLERLVGIEGPSTAFQIIRNPFNLFKHTTVLLGSGDVTPHRIARTMMAELENCDRLDAETPGEREILTKIVEGTKTELDGYIPLKHRLRSCGYH